MIQIDFWVKHIGKEINHPTHGNYNIIGATVNGVVVERKLPDGRYERKEFNHNEVKIIDLPMGWFIKEIENIMSIDLKRKMTIKDLIIKNRHITHAYPRSLTMATFYTYGISSWNTARYFKRKSHAVVLKSIVYINKAMRKPKYRNKWGYLAFGLTRIDDQRARIKV